ATADVLTPMPAGSRVLIPAGSSVVIPPALLLYLRMPLRISAEGTVRTALSWRLSRLPSSLMKDTNRSLSIGAPNVPPKTLRSSFGRGTLGEDALLNQSLAVVTVLR